MQSLVGAGIDGVTGGSTDRCRVILLLIAAAYLYLNLFALPNTPFLLGGDQAYFWMDGQRMLYGDQPYRDFFQFTPPGTDLFYLVMFKLFGPYIWITNMSVLVLGVALTWICYEVAGEIMEPRPALFSALLFLILIYGKALNGTHHWFSILAAMSAVRIGQRPKAARWTNVAAGALLGVASFFTQTRGVAVLLAFAIFLLWKRSQAKETWRDLARSEFALFAAFAIVLITLNSWFVATVGVRRLWYDQITYVRRFMVHGLMSQFMGLPEPLSLATLPRLAPYLFVYASLPIIYALALWRCWGERRNPTFRWQPATLLTLVGLFLLMEVASSLNWLRLYAVSLPGIILLVWTVGRTQRIRRYAVVIMWLSISAIAIHQTLSRYRSGYVTIETPGGKTVVSPLTYSKLQSMMRYTEPGQFIFQAAGPSIYLPLQLRNPLFMDAVETNQQTRPEQIEQAVQQLEAKKLQFVLWSPRLDAADRFDRSTEQTIAPLRNYVRERYARVLVFSDQDELWERK
jgi:Dolichyl-phosphate-mannose-protein mannosyltransferase